MSDFDPYAFHDNHVHALRIVAGPDGTSGELHLDLDHIVEWGCDAGDGVHFRLQPATLVFRDVSDLRVALDYATPCAALGPFSIHTIERRQEPRERYVATLWRIALNWPSGEIAFEAGVEPVLVPRGAAIESHEQVLRPEQRGG